MKSSIQGNALEEQRETHIYCLPDELFAFIFKRLLDAKCLCRCYLVSKRFASIIPHISDVSLTIPQRKSSFLKEQNVKHQEESFPKNMLNFFFKNVYIKPIHFLRCIFGPKPPLSTSFDPIAFFSALKFLKKFIDIKSLHVELPSFHKNKSVMRWEAEFGKDLSFCVVLFASSFRRRNLGEAESDMQSVSLTNELLRSRANIAMRRFMDALWRNHILRHIIEDHNALQNLTITDSKKEGILYWGEKEIADFHDSVLTFPASGYVKIWHAPTLHLLTSDKVMEGATILMIRLFDHHSGDEDVIMDRIFRGVEICREAVREIYERHKAEALTFMIELDVP